MSASEFTFAVVYRCARGHEQSLRFGDGFVRKQVELHTWLMLTSPGACAHGGAACGSPISATIQNLSLHGSPPVVFDPSTFRMRDDDPTEPTPASDVDRCEGCGVAVPVLDDPSALGWRLDSEDSCWTCPTCAGEVPS